MTAFKVKKSLLLVLLQHALGGHHSGYHNHGHRADHPRKKQIFENRKYVVDHKIHDF